MRDPTLPAALVCVALGLSLAFAPKRTWAAHLLVLAITSTVIALFGVPASWIDGVFLGGWISVAASAAVVHLPRAIVPRVAIAASCNAGIWSGAGIALAGSPTGLLRTLPYVLVCVPAAWLVGRHLPIALKVVSSWLIAIALLAAILQCLAVTPGYAPDHLE